MKLCTKHVPFFSINKDTESSVILSCDCSQALHVHSSSLRLHVFLFLDKISSLALVLVKSSFPLTQIEPDLPLFYLDCC